ncbi:trigger factor [Zhaonella formicivorans]|jgi:trigger factor|uniref:trigger factor n=1 Tax=Zhaonella formicivorans TaxID=2528593 RepID=UPI0010D9B4EC|nr:trigger factor [Zhaonella formicivorans]
MKSNVEKIERNRVVLQVEVETGELEKGIHQAYKKLVKKVNIPGFRKGKAPRKILENYIGKEYLLSEAADIILPNAYYDAVQENALEPIDQPEVEVVQLEDGQPFIFKATVDVKPEVKLGEYKGLEVKKKAYEVKEEDVQKFLENLQQRYAKLVNKENGNAEKGDIALIDFEGFIDGEAFPGGKGENYSLEIGSGTFIPGFEDQLIGMAAEEEKEINVTFPEDYHQEDLAGKPATFKVKIKGIKTKELSPIDDEFAKDVSEFETLEELKNDTRNKLKETAENRSQDEIRTELINKVVESSEVEIPNIMIERRIASFVNDFANRVQQQGLSFEKYLELSGLSLDQLKENYRAQAEKSVKTDLVLEAVAKKENIDVSEEELDKEVEQIAKVYRQDPKAFKAYLASQGTLDSLKQSIILDKAVDLLVEEAKIEVVPADAEEAQEERESN